MKLAMYQMKNEGSIQKNLDKSLWAIKEAAKNGADLLLFPEVQLTEFFPQYPGLDVRHYGVSMDSDLVMAFREASRENHIMTVPNIYLKENGMFYDVSLLISKEGEILGQQKMVHVAYAEKFYETDYYTPSEEGFRIFETELGNIGIVVCFDRHYPESIRTETLMGADLILVPTVNTKEEPMELFEQEIRVQAFQNSVMIAMCNRVGREDEMEFSGESLLVDANGMTKIKGGDREELIYADLYPKDARRLRSARPYTNLRRPEFYL